MTYLFGLACFVAGVLTSSYAWWQIHKNYMATCEAEKVGIDALKDKLLDEMVDYANEREKLNEEINHFNYLSKQVKADQKALDARQQELAVREAALSKTEKDVQERVTQIEGQLKGAREKARRLAKKSDFHARLGVSSIQEEDEH